MKKKNKKELSKLQKIAIIYLGIFFLIIPIFCFVMAIITLIDDIKLDIYGKTFKAEIINVYVNEEENTTIDYSSNFWRTEKYKTYKVKGNYRVAYPKKYEDEKFKAPANINDKKGDIVEGVYLENKQSEFKTYRLNPIEKNFNYVVRDIIVLILSIIFIMIIIFALKSVINKAKSINK